MGYVAHDAVIVTTWRDRSQWPDVEAFRQNLPDDWRRLVIGPIPSVVNSDTTWVFAPDGSKSGWDTDRQGDEYRAQFVALFSSIEFGFDVVELRYGSDFRYDFDQPVAAYAEPIATADNAGPAATE